MKITVIVCCLAVLVACAVVMLSPAGFAEEQQKPPDKPAEDAPPKEEEKPPEFVIDDYDFTWHVATVGDVIFDVKKDEDKTQARITKDFGSSLYMSAVDAEAIAAILSKTDEYYAKFKGKESQSEEVKAGGFIITFMTTDDATFYVHIRQDERMSSIMLERKEANGLAPVMAKSTRMCAFVDERIKP
jgi:hypothetical protein